MPMTVAKSAANEIAKDWLTMAFAGLGISTAPHQFFGGLFLSCAVASLIARRRNDPRKLWSVIATAAIAATIAAIYGAGNDSAMFPPQIAMTIAGTASGVIVNIIVKILDRGDERAGELADRFIDSKFPKGD
ncbi:hypothetical protein [Shimia sp.]|uniref:hypothetical protein n=1 Tax=Shimia sp. TaxID=1954381 RepID=UPI003BAB8290